jgi:hypothetical protein
MQPKVRYQFVAAYVRICSLHHGWRFECNNISISANEQEFKFSQGYDLLHSVLTNHRRYQLSNCHLRMILGRKVLHYSGMLCVFQVAISELHDTT